MNKEKEMFNFRIINTPDGNQIIDRKLKTPEDSLTVVQLMEYMEMDATLSYMDKMEKKAQKEAERQRKLARNPLRRIACLCGIV